MVSDYANSEYSEFVKKLLHWCPKDNDSEFFEHAFGRTLPCRPVQASSQRYDARLAHQCHNFSSESFKNLHLDPSARSDENQSCPLPKYPIDCIRMLCPH